MKSDADVIKDFKEAGESGSCVDPGQPSAMQADFAYHADSVPDLPSQTVNMTADELREWLETKDSKETGALP